MEVLGSTEEERGRLLIDHLLQSMNPKVQGQVAHGVNAKWLMTGLPIGNWSNLLSRRKQ